MEWFSEFFAQIQEVSAGLGDYLSVTMIIRLLLPISALVVVVRCAKSLLRDKSEGEIWAQLQMENGVLIDLNYWENVMGRSKASDVLVEFPTVSRNHAALIRDDKGNWQIYDIESKTGVIVNEKKIEKKDDITDKTNGFTTFLRRLFRTSAHDGIDVKTGDKIEIGGVSLFFVAADKTDEYEQSISRTRPGRLFRQHTTLFYLTQFQLLLAAALYISAEERYTTMLLMCFLALTALTWSSYLVTKALRRTAFEIETLGFFLTTIGLAVTASSTPSELPRQILYIIAALIMFFAMGLFLRDIDRVKKFRKPIAVLGPLLLAVTYLFGRVTGLRTYGAIRWIVIGGISVQPSEFVKIAMIFAGAATLERLFARRNLIGFIGMTGACMVCLAIMTDFGSALIFLVAYLVIAYMRSGDVATMFLSIAGTGFAGLVALASRPHIAGRFATWGNAWEFADVSGYQQTRAMSAAASGGLFGIGAGNGWFKNIFAGDSDLVFAMVSEELGLIIALIMLSAIIMFAIYSIHASGTSRSSLYTIAACAASAVLIFQMLLNVLGSMDILPFTGVTLPFVSKGGTSLVACWGMLAFFKSVDTRQNASFAVKLPKRPTHGGGGTIVYQVPETEIGDRI